MFYHLFLAPGPVDCKCGLANRAQRIVGGVETEVNEYPWQAALVFRSGFLGIPFCGGSLVNSRWVEICWYYIPYNSITSYLQILTAAHCVKGMKISSFQVSWSILGDSFGFVVRLFLVNIMLGTSQRVMWGWMLAGFILTLSITRKERWRMTSPCWSWRRMLTMLAILWSDQCVCQQINLRPTLESLPLCQAGEQMLLMVTSLTFFRRLMWLCWPMKNACKYWFLFLHWIVLHHTEMITSMRLMRLMRPCCVLEWLVVARMLVRETLVTFWNILLNSECLCCQEVPWSPARVTEWLQDRTMFR